MRNSSPAQPPAPGNPDWVLEFPEPIAPGVYPATIRHIEQRQSDDGRDWLAWDFELEDGRIASGGSSFSTSPRSKSFAWVAAVLGRAAIGGPAQIRAADLIGRAVLVSIIDDAEGFSKVDSVMAPQGKRTPESGIIDD